MEWTGLNEIREKYLSFFESKEHLRLPSFPLVPQGDNSLLLINSGMAPMKPYFSGELAPPSKRVTTCQKCVRVIDIERVGKTSRHCTFFEMLGHFSFGDYFKREAITWTWEFFTKVMGIDPSLLYCSVYLDDDEAWDIWTKEIGIDPSHMARLGKDDNFWDIGSGPCGPSSEIYFDRGPEHGCGKPDCAVGCDCDRFVEIGNNVFTQFDNDGAGNYTPLAQKNIDFGMGLERLACVVQGVESVFGIDTIRNIMNHVVEITGKAYGQDEKADVSLRIITDHIRSTVFMVGDGVVPQNEGRGYVLRRLLRRAARHGLLLGVKRPFLHEVAETVIGENSGAYPGLVENRDYILKVIRVEEERFLRTIEQGMDMLMSLIDRVGAMRTGKVISGEDVFRLYDTFGFPLDLTREIASDRGLTVDEDEFGRFMQLQRERARKARESLGDLAWEEDALKGEEIPHCFVGYGALSSDTEVLAIIAGGERAEQVTEGDEAVVILRETPFYAESGGQVGDTGVINFGKSMFKVTDCKKSPGGLFMHIGIMKSGFLCVGDRVTVHVDRERRRAIMRNHTATHLLQAALREVLGSHVHQAGSLVDPEICRFDFTHFSAVTPEQLAEAEAIVNRRILEAHCVKLSEMPIAEAKKMNATALFGDKYSDIVRVCDIAGKSVELCGGTHVSNTAEIGLFKILSESSVAAGVRRIEGTTGAGVLLLIERQNELLCRSAEALKAGNPAELPVKAAAAAQQIRELQKQYEELQDRLTGAQLEAVESMPKIGPVRFVSAALGGASADALKHAADKLKDKHPDIVGVIASFSSEKATLLAFAGKDAVKAGIHAGNLVREVAKAGGGSGGGRPDSAMGGLPDPTRLDDVLLAAPDIVRAMLGIS